MRALRQPSSTQLQHQQQAMEPHRGDKAASSATGGAESGQTEQRPAADTSKVKKDTKGKTRPSEPAAAASQTQQDVDIVAAAEEVTARVIQHADEELKDDPPFDMDEVHPDPEGYDTDESD